MPSPVSEKVTLPPAFNLPSVNGANGVEGNGGNVPVPPQNPPAPKELPQEPPKDNARSLLQSLDSMLIRAAKISTRSVDGAALKSAVAGIKFGGTERDDLEAAVANAQHTLSELARFSGRQIAAAMSVGDNGAFAWTNNAAAQAVRDAIDAQAKLSDILHGLANRPDVAGETFDSICEMALACDRRQSEIATLSMQLADAVAQNGDDPEVAARLDATVGSLLPRQALSMHGNESAIEKLRAHLQPLAARLDDFAARPNASISNAEFMGYAVEVIDAAAALEKAAREGFPTGDGGRVMPDKSFLDAAVKLVSFAREKLENAREKICNVSLNHFAQNVLGVSDDFAVIYEENLPALEQSCPNLAKAARLRHELGKLALGYVKEQTKDAVSRMNTIVVKMTKLDQKAIDEEVKSIRAAVKSDGEDDMTPEDWDALAASFKCVGATYTQVVHFVNMVRGSMAKLSPEQFLSTSSARALVEGRLQFSSLVEARIHGMSDGDVDPQLDDSRMVSSKKLGSGGANTVHLVTYADGRECVFKPEAAGRQGMARILLSKDYRADQQVANLNLATQTAALALGLAGLVPKCSVGSHKGQYGLFMDRAPGMESREFARGKKIPGRLTPAEIRNLPEEQYRIVTGRLMRELNRLQWLDIVTGQGDRHNSNYLVDVREDLTVTVTGIDNDQCFTGYRTGAQTYVLKGRDADRFRLKRSEVAGMYPVRLRQDADERLKADPGVTELPDGSIRIEPSKIEAQELHLAVRRSIGLQGSAMPDFIDEELFASLVTLKAGDARAAYLADLSRRLPPEAVASATARLDEAIAHAEKLQSEGKVVATDDFSRADVQDRLIARDLAIPDNPIKPIDSYQLNNKTVVAEIRYQKMSIFARDIFRALDRGAAGR